jgi:hypothetical protein
MAFDLLGIFMEFECGHMTKVDWLDSLLWFLNRFVNLNIWVWACVYIVLQSKKYRTTTESRQDKRNRKVSYLAGSESPLIVMKIN